MTFPNDPARLLGKLRAANQGRDVHLVGGPRTIETFRALGALIPGSSRPGQLPEGTLPASCSWQRRRAVASGPAIAVTPAQRSPASSGTPATGATAPSR